MILIMSKTDLSHICFDSEAWFLNYICKWQYLKRGIILMNLGSPDSTEVHEVRKYLNEFLTDKRVIDSWSVRNLLVQDCDCSGEGTQICRSISHDLDKKRISAGAVYP